MPMLPEHESMLRTALDAMDAQGAELLERLELPDFGRAEHIGEVWWSPATGSLTELRIDAKEDKLVRALLVGMLRERQHGGWRS